MGEAKNSFICLIKYRCHSTFPTNYNYTRFLTPIPHKFHSAGFHLDFRRLRTTPLPLRFGISTPLPLLRFLLSTSALPRHCPKMNPVQALRPPSVSMENAGQLVRQKSADVANNVTDRRRLCNLSNAQAPALKPQQQQLPHQTGGHLAVPDVKRPRLGGSRSNSTSSAAGSRQLNSVSSLSSNPEPVGNSTALLKEVEDIDALDADNPQLVSVYVKEVYSYLRKLEDDYSIRPNYMSAAGNKGDKPEITARMRSILIDWLIQVHNRFSLLQETLFLSIGILDRFLQVKIKEIGRKNLQLVGITAMWIAAKYEEIYSPEVNDFVYITDNAYSPLDMRKMELDILKTLECHLGRPLALHFLRRYSKVGEVDSIQHALAKFFMEVTLLDYGFVHVNPSLIAAAALWLAIKLEDKPTVLSPWTDKLRHYSGYEESDIISFGSKIADQVVKLPTAKCNFVFNKYQSGKFMKISSTSFVSGPAIRDIAKMTES